MRRRREISSEEARRVGDSLYLDWDQVDLEQFRQGLMGYQRQGSDYRGVLLAGRTVLAHMQQFPDYFVRLARLRAEAKHAAAGRDASRKAARPSSFQRR
jgi:hypothetical protein